jgi:hypothetical protein
MIKAIAFDYGGVIEIEEGDSIQEIKRRIIRDIVIKL